MTRQEQLEKILLKIAADKAKKAVAVLAFEDIKKVKPLTDV